jgi:hypothetical protein
MRKRSKLLLTGLTAALLLAIGVSTASANILSSLTEDFRAIWTALTFAGGGSSIICPVSLLGSLHRRTIAKSEGALIGAITSAAVGRCQGDGRATILRETLPWHLVYDFFLFELPNIEEIAVSLVGASFRVTDGIPCLVRTDVFEPASAFLILDPGDGEVDSIRADEVVEIDIDDPGFLCDLAGDANLTGTGTVTAASGIEMLIGLI